MAKNSYNNRKTLWRIWYVILLFGLYSYLIYNSVCRYLEFKRSVYNPRFGGHWSHVGMNFYLAMLITSLTFFPFIIYSAILRVGNYASDGDLIGHDTDNLSLVRNLLGVMRTHSDDGQGESMSGSWTRIRRNFLPIPSFFHVLSAFCMYIPIPILHGQLISKAQKDPKHIWESDIGFLLQPQNQLNDLPIKKEQWIEVLIVTPEFFNLCLALLLLSIRYPSTFWYTNRSFSIIFSVMAFVTAFHGLVDINAAAILHKLVHYMTYPNINNGIISSIARLKQPLLLPGLALTLSAFGSIVSLLSLYLIFEYGYGHFLSSLDLSTSASHTGVHSPTYNGRQGNAFSKRYLLPIGAISAILFPALLKSPILWDCARYKEHSSVLLINLVVSFIYLSLWLMVWMAFLMKNDWKFEVHFPVQNVTEIYNNGTNGSVGNNNGSIRKVGRDRLESSNGSAVYTMFPEVEDGSGRGLPMSPGLQSTDCYSEDTDASSRGGSNYVYLQSDPSVTMVGSVCSYGNGQGIQNGRGTDEESQSSYTSSQTPQQIEMATIEEDDDERPTTGVLKYAVSRGSFRSNNQYVREPDISTSPIGDNPTAASATMMGTGSLNRNSRFRKSGNRVTFKEDSEQMMLPGNSGVGGDAGSAEPINSSLESAATIASIDSGIVAARKRSLSEANDSDGADDVFTSTSLPQDDPPYYNQADFAAANYDARYAMQPTRRRSVDVFQESGITQPLPIVTPRSPFSSLKRQRVNEILPIDDQRLCSQV